MTSQKPLETGKKAHKEITNMSLYTREVSMSFLQLASTIAYNHTNASTNRAFANSIAGETGQLLQTKGFI